MIGKVLGIALLGISVIPTFAHADDSNPCAATVTSTGVRQQADQPDRWQFTFNVVAGLGSGVSSGSFTYSFTYVDSNNVAHTNNINSGPSWAAGDGHEVDLSDTKTLVDAVSVSDLRVYDIHSGGCS